MPPLGAMGCHGDYLKKLGVTVMPHLQTTGEEEVWGMIVLGYWV